MGEKSKVTSLVENEPRKNLGKVSDLFNFSIMSSYVLVSRVIMDIFSHVFIICTSNVVIHECEARVNTTLRVQIMNTSEKISIFTRAKLKYYLHLPMPYW